jgi:predicted transcriptional regulator
MTSKAKLGIGGSALDDAAAFVDAWERPDGDAPVCDRVVTFESWEGLASVMSGERLALLKHLHARPELSDETLAQALNRDRGQVASDLDALEGVGLVERSGRGLRVTADAIATEILL